MKKPLKVREFPTIIEKDEAGYLFAYVPSLQGCYTQGRTLEQVLKNIREAIVLHLEDRRLRAEAIPHRRPVSFTALEVRA